jgi:hypothetical protein
MILSIRKKRPTSLWMKRDNRTIYHVEGTEGHLLTIPLGPYVHKCPNDPCPPCGHEIKKDDCR